MAQRFALWLALASVATTLFGTARSKELFKPQQHFSIQEPAKLSNAEAESIYDRIADQMALGYSASGEPAAKVYRKWRRYNIAPYISATHGNRYINHYANSKASRYDRVKGGKKLPVGAIIAKDSFTVLSDGRTSPGALFLMEKLPVGTSPDTGDWRYVMILPDASYFGDTSDGSEALNFCHSCHTTVADTDYLFYIPEKYRKP